MRVHLLTAHTAILPIGITLSFYGMLQLNLHRTSLQLPALLASPRSAVEVTECRLLTL